MSVLFAAMVGFSLVCALFQGHLPDLTQALLTGGSEAVTLLLRLAGGLCLWSGVMEVAVQSGLTRSLSQALLPITRRLFPELSPGCWGWGRRPSLPGWRPCAPWSRQPRGGRPAAV